MEKRGEEGEGRDGSLHPLEFSKVGAYVHHSPGPAAAKCSIAENLVLYRT